MCVCKLLGVCTHEAVLMWLPHANNQITKFNLVDLAGAS